MTLCFNFYGVIYLVKSDNEEITQRLRGEFDLFLSEEGSSDVTIEIFLNDPPPFGKYLSHKILSHAIIYRSGKTSYIDYEGKALVIKTGHHYKIYSPDEDFLFELSFLTVYSALQKKILQKKGCFVHALGISIRKENLLVLLPSGGGKSTLMLNLLKLSETKIISDDCPLIDFKGNIHTFATKLSLENPPDSGEFANLTWHRFNRRYFSPKWNLSLSDLETRIEKTPEENSANLILGIRMSDGMSALEPVRKYKMIKPLFENMIIGVGLAQVIELFLTYTWKDLFLLPYYFLKRSFAAIRLLKKSRTFILYMGKDQEETADVLASYFKAK